MTSVLSTSPVQRRQVDTTFGLVDLVLGDLRGGEHDGADGDRMDLGGANRGCHRCGRARVLQISVVVGVGFTDEGVSPIS